MSSLTRQELESQVNDLKEQLRINIQKEKLDWLLQGDKKSQDTPVLLPFRLE